MPAPCLEQFVGLALHGACHCEGCCGTCLAMLCMCVLYAVAKLVQLCVSVSGVISACTLCILCLGCSPQRPCCSLGSALSYYPSVRSRQHRCHMHAAWRTRCCRCVRFSSAKGCRMFVGCCLQWIVRPSADVAGLCLARLMLLRSSCCFCCCCP